MVWGLFPVDPLSGEDKYYIFTKGNYKIGRKGCDIIINKDKGVSRIHAELTLDATSVSTSRRSKSSEPTFVIRVKDCSKYGTFIKTELGTKDKVHELPNKEKILNDGDVITFGTGAAIYRLSLVPLVFYFCPSSSSSKTFKVDRSIQEAVSSIGARIVTTLSEECTHVLVEPRMQVNEALVNSLLSKKPIFLTNWIMLLAEKSIRSEFPGNSQYRPSVMVDEALVDVMEPNVREKCLEGFTFVLESEDTYKFGSSFSSLLEACGAEIVSVPEISEESQYEETNRTICVITESSGDKFSRLKHLSSLSRVKEMDLIRAMLSGNLPSTSLILPSVAISSSCSTDETIVADSDVEEETSSVRMIDAEDKKLVSPIVIEESPVTILEEEEETVNLIRGEIAPMIIEESPVMILEEEEEEIKTVNLSEDTEMKEDREEEKKKESENVIMRRDRNEEAECGNSEIIYTQDLIVKDLRLFGNVRFTRDEGEVVDFKRFKKGNVVTSGNSFSNLIPFAKDPYKEYNESEEVMDFMKEEKKRKQREAVAEDLFTHEKARKRGTAAASGSIREFLTRG